MTPTGHGAIFSHEPRLPFEARSPVSRHPAPRALAALSLGLALSLALTACDDPLSSRLISLPSEPGQATLVSLEDGSLRQESAFDIAGSGPVRTDQTSEWDFAVDRDGAGDLLFAPRNVILEASSAAGLQRIESSFEDLTVAPEEGYTSDETVPVEEGAVYAARSRRDPNVRVSCFRFMKLEVVSVDRAGGLVTFRHLINPNCGRRTLVAGASGEDQDV